MPALLYKAEARLPYLHGGDNWTSNTFWFIADDSISSQDAAGSIATQLNIFYETLSGWLSTNIERQGITYTVYDAEALRDDPPGALGPPIYEEGGSIGAAVGGIPMPDDVAVALSYRLQTGYFAVPETVPGDPPGPAGDTHPRASRRSRIWVGPLQTTTLTTNGDAGVGWCAVSSGFIDELLDAAQALHDHSVGEAEWSIWSQATQTVHAIDYAWVDDRFDSQDRRKAQPSTATKTTRQL